MQQTLLRRMAILVAGVTLISIYLLNGLFQADGRLLAVTGALVQSVAVLLSTCCLIVTYRKASGYRRVTWLCLLLGGISSFIGHMGFYAQPLLFHTQAPISGWPNVFLLLQALLYGLAVFVEFANHFHTNKRICHYIDVLIVLTAAFALCWQWMIQLFMHTSSNTGSLLFALFYPLADVGILCGIISIFLVTQRIAFPATLSLLGAGMLLQTIADLGYLHAGATGVALIGGGFAALRAVALLIFGLAGLYIIADHHDGIRADKGQKHLSGNKGLIVRLVIPYIFVLILFITMFAHADNSKAAMIGSLICVCLIMLRQVLTRIENQALHDTLSGLPNRRLFEDRLASSLERAQKNQGKVAVLLLDLDRFKNVNDSLGHSFGDKLLMHVAVKLYEWVAQSDTICRLSGDEFAILLEGFAETHHLQETVEKLVQQFNRPFRLDQQELHFTASIGISVFPYDGQDPETLLRHAETAMFRVKKAGKNHYQFFDQTMADSSRFELEHALRKALEREEFLVYYQPRVSSQGNRIVGMEALLRWHRPNHGIVSPGEFIPLAEETGLIIPIGEWVLRTACFQTKRWLDEGLPPLRVAVNLSAMQFKQGDLVAMIERILSESQLEPQYLELEITESVAMQDVKTATEKLKLLEQMGVEISIDDFGTGYSSLRYLGQFPINTLKIDRSFVREITHNPNHVAIVTAITALGRSLQLKVLAEGVEQDDQLEVLRRIGCQEMQGYYYSPPLPAEQFAALLISAV